VVVFIEGLFFSGSFSFFGAFLKDTYDLSYLGISVILGGFGLGNVLYICSVKWWVAHFGKNGLMLCGGLVACGGYILIALIHDQLLFFPFVILITLGYYMIHKTLQAEFTELNSGTRGTAVSLFDSTLFLGQGVGVAMLGVIVNRPDGYIVSFCLSGVAMALLGIWLAWHSRRNA
jgi:predicted MFS family arabinose efflux permease